MNRRLTLSAVLGSSALAAAWSSSVIAPADAAFTPDEWSCPVSSSYVASTPVVGHVRARDVTGKHVNSATVTFSVPSESTKLPDAEIQGTGHTVGSYLLTDPTGDTGAVPAESQPFDVGGNTLSFTHLPLEERPSQFYVAFDPADGSSYCAATVLVSWVP